MRKIRRPASAELWAMSKHEAVGRFSRRLVAGSVLRLRYKKQNALLTLKLKAATNPRVTPQALQSLLLLHVH